MPAIATAPVRVRARVQEIPNGVAVSVGGRSFHIHTGRRDRQASGSADFALFGLAALSMSHNVGFVLENPVSEEGLSAVRRIGEVWRAWTPYSEYKLHPLRLDCLEVRPAASFPRARDAGAVVCFSGGVDATFAACRRTEARRRAPAS